jgi:hypothetical protein
MEAELSVNLKRIASDRKNLLFFGQGRWPQRVFPIKINTIRNQSLNQVFKISLKRTTLNE